MKPIFANIALALSLFFLVTVPASAAAPTLEQPSNANFPVEVVPGNTYIFHLIYKQPSGDMPKKLVMHLDTPNGPVPVPGQITDGTDAGKGVTATWSVTPVGSGTYRYRFEAISNTGDSIQYPASPDDPLEFVAISTVTKIIILLVGLVIALLFLPFVVYVGTRALNKRADPAGAARVALLIGAAASLGLLLCLFVIQGFNYNWLGWALGALTILAILVVLFSRRRAV
ncbi:MAG: alkaline shock response membrane anchor protein AmaP [Armatimonadota bacterium]|nr:alkaline shock response membrane anchor protein AmaP [Armatimonadota bacterium]